MDPGAPRTFTLCLCTLNSAWTPVPPGTSTARQRTKWTPVRFRKADPDAPEHPHCANLHRQRLDPVPAGTSVAHTCAKWTPLPSGTKDDDAWTIVRFRTVDDALPSGTPNVRFRTDDDAWTTVRLRTRKATCNTKHHTTRCACGRVGGGSVGSVGSVGSAE